MLENPAGGRPLQLNAGDILLLPGNRRHILHDGSGAAPLPARNRASFNFTISQNLGSDERLDLLCGHFEVAPPHDRLLRSYLPTFLVVNAGAYADEKETAGQLGGLAALMRRESADDHLGAARCRTRCRLRCSRLCCGSQAKPTAHRAVFLGWRVILA
nr:cupin domain-containing protein [Bradyrhizobium diazoefficiens]